MDVSTTQQYFPYTYNKQEEHVLEIISKKI